MNTQTTSNGEDSPCVAVVPTGATLLENLNSYIKGALINNPNGSVQPTNTPLTPDFTAQYTTSTNQVISITATVKIDAAVTINDLQVYQKEATLDGVNVLKQLYIGYCYQEEVPSGLYPYTFTFEVSSQVTIDGAPQTINEIELYLYDEDPITSSGKKATVQPST
jgi:hypothetical protein